MGRPRSNYICPKCGKQGYLERNASRNGKYPNSEYKKYWTVVHYDSLTKKRHRHYLGNKIGNKIIGQYEYNQHSLKEVNFSIKKSISPTLNNLITEANNTIEPIKEKIEAVYNYLVNTEDYTPLEAVKLIRKKLKDLPIEINELYDQKVE